MSQNYTEQDLLNAQVTKIHGEISQMKKPWSRQPKTLVTFIIAILTIMVSAVQLIQNSLKLDETRNQLREQTEKLSQQKEELTIIKSEIQVVENEKKAREKELTELNVALEKTKDAFTAATNQMDAVRDRLQIRNAEFEKMRKAKGITAPEDGDEEILEKTRLLSTRLRTSVQDATTRKSVSAHTTETNAAPLATGRPPRIFIRIENQNVLELAKDVQRKLEAKGFIVPGIQLVRDNRNYTGSGDIRFFKAEDQGTANQIHDTLNAYLNGLSLAVKDFSTNPIWSSRAIPGYLEIWLSEK